MAEQALVVDSGRLLAARLLKGDDVEGVTHCALGDGDATFTDPNHPPAPSAGQAALKNEFVRKRAYRTAFLAEDPEGNLSAGGKTYAESEAPADTVAFFFRFDDYEATASVIKEVGFFGGTVQYMPGVSGAAALNGVHDPDANPDGEVLDPGLLYEVRNVPDYSKDGHTMLELVAVVRIAPCTAE